MFYFIKFLYTTVLLPPGFFILLLIIFTLWLAKRRQRVWKPLAIFTLVFYLCCTTLVSGALVRSLEGRYTPPTAVKGDIIIVLGGGATFDTPNFSTAGHLSGSAANRLLTSMQLYQQLHIPILISGGRVFETTGREAEIARDILLRLGVPDAMIIIEDRSVNTTENAKFSKVKMTEAGLSHPILVTSAFHMPRAVKQFQKAGLAVTPFPADYLTNVNAQLDFRSWWPEADALYNLSLAIKEYVGLIAIQWY